MTEEDLAKYYSRYGAAQGVDRMMRRAPRLLRRMEATGTASQQVALGTEAGMQADEHAMATLRDPTPAQRAKAHEIRDMLAVRGLMGRRRYKG